jgi:hypothetical protein
MATNARGRNVVFVVLLGVWLLLPTFIQAQVGYYTELRFVQRFAWIGDAYALRYEVVIEKEEDGGFREQHRALTNEVSIEFSLSPGNYRYQVIPYDFLNRPAAGSGWVNFTVYPALRPEINDFSPSYLYLNESAVHTLNILGRNFVPGAEIELRRPGGVSIVPNNISIPRDGTSAQLNINNDRLVLGEYEVFVRNPGGFDTRGGSVIVMYFLPAPGNMRPSTGYNIGIEQLRNQRNLVFSWSTVQGANAYIFTLYEQTANGRRIIVSIPPENRTTWTLEDIRVLDPGTYVWEVEAISRDALGVVEQRGRTGVNTFILDVPMPGTVRVDNPGILYAN